MKAHTTPTGIELLMPLVPKEAVEIRLGIGMRGVLWYKHSGFHLYPSYRIELSKYNSADLTFLGTCWHKGEALICEGFEPKRFVGQVFETEDAPHDPYSLGYKDYMDADTIVAHACDSFDSWLRSEGITIPEGMKAVIIKVN